MSSISQTRLIHAADKSPTFYMGEKESEDRERNKAAISNPTT